MNSRARHRRCLMYCRRNLLLTVNETTMNNNVGVSFDVLQCKTFAIGPDESARDCVKIALDHLEMRDADPGQYQLWAKTPREEPTYSLFGHEKPYSIKLSCLRDGLSTEEGFDLDHCNNVHDPLARCHFVLRCVAQHSY